MAKSKALMDFLKDTGYYEDDDVPMSEEDQEAMFPAPKMDFSLNAIRNGHLKACDKKEEILTAADVADIKKRACDLADKLGMDFSDDEFCDGIDDEDYFSLFPSNHFEEKKLPTGENENNLNASSDSLTEQEKFPDADAEMSDSGSGGKRMKLMDESPMSDTEVQEDSTIAKGVAAMETDDDDDAKKLVSLGQPSSNEVSTPPCVDLSKDPDPASSNVGAEDAAVEDKSNDIQIAAVTVTPPNQANDDENVFKKQASPTENETAVTAHITTSVETLDEPAACIATIEVSSNENSSSEEDDTTTSTTPDHSTGEENELEKQGSPNTTTPIPAPGALEEQSTSIATSEVSSNEHSLLNGVATTASDKSTGEETELQKQELTNQCRNEKETMTNVNGVETLKEPSVFTGTNEISSNGHSSLDEVTTAVPDHSTGEEKELKNQNKLSKDTETEPIPDSVLTLEEPSTVAHNNTITSNGYSSSEEVTPIVADGKQSEDADVRTETKVTNGTNEEELMDQTDVEEASTNEGGQLPLPVVQVPDGLTKDLNGKPNNAEIEKSDSNAKNGLEEIGDMSKEKESEEQLGAVVASVAECSISSGLLAKNGFDKIEDMLMDKEPVKRLGTVVASVAEDNHSHNSVSSPTAKLHSLSNQAERLNKDKQVARVNSQAVTRFIPDKGKAAPASLLKPELAKIVPSQSQAVKAISIGSVPSSSRAVAVVAPSSSSSSHAAQPTSAVQQQQQKQPSSPVYICSKSDIPRHLKCNACLRFLLDRKSDEVLRVHMLLMHSTECTDEIMGECIRWARKRSLQRCLECRSCVVDAFEEHKYDCVPSVRKTSNLFMPLEVTYHKCVICKLQFRWRYDLKMHIHATHPTVSSKMMIEPFFRCGQCWLLANSSEELGIHCINCNKLPGEYTIRTLGISLLGCDFCKVLHDTIEDATKCYKDRGYFRCIFCLMLLKDRRRIMAHLQTYHLYTNNVDAPVRRNVFELCCPVCGFGPCSYEDILPHLISKHFVPALETEIAQNKIKEMRLLERPGVSKYGSVVPMSTAPLTSTTSTWYQWNQNRLASRELARNNVSNIPPASSPMSGDHTTIRDIGGPPGNVFNSDKIAPTVGMASTTVAMARPLSSNPTIPIDNTYFEWARQFNANPIPPNSHRPFLPTTFKSLGPTTTPPLARGPPPLRFHGKGSNGVGRPIPLPFPIASSTQTRPGMAVVGKTHLPVSTTTTLTQLKSSSSKPVISPSSSLTTPPVIMKKLSPNQWVVVSESSREAQEASAKRVVETSATTIAGPGTSIWDVGRPGSSGEPTKRSKKPTAANGTKNVPSKSTSTATHQSSSSSSSTVIRHTSKP